MESKMPQLRKPTPPKPCLTKMDALEYAAERLEGMATSIELSNMLITMVGRDNLLKEARSRDDDHSKDLVGALESLVEPELQIQACRDAAKQIRDFVLEEKILQARVQTANIGKA